MKKLIRTIIGNILLTLSLAMNSSPVYAAEEENKNPFAGFDPTTWKSDLKSEGPDGSSVKDTLGSAGLATTDAQTALVDWINFALSFVSVIAALMIIIGGYWYITGGEDGKKKGQEWIVNAVLGIALILSAWVIVNTFLSY